MDFISIPPNNHMATLKVLFYNGLFLLDGILGSFDVSSAEVLRKLQEAKRYIVMSA